MPKWGKVVLRTVGAINVAAVAFGVYCLSSPFYAILSGRMASPGVVPFLRSAYGAMLVINLLFLGVLLVTAIRFIQARSTAVNLYSLTVLLLGVYCIGVHLLWRAGHGIGLECGCRDGNWQYGDRAVCVSLCGTAGISARVHGFSATAQTALRHAADPRRDLKISGFTPQGGEKN